MIVSIAGYRFVKLEQLTELRQLLIKQCKSLALKGTILLSAEGINLNLAGTADEIGSFKHQLTADLRFVNMRFHEASLEAIPFKRLKVKIKKEIITFNQSGIDATEQRAKAVLPATLKQWLDENRDITLLDTRNDYEVELGTFKGALNLHLNHFSELPQAVNSLDRNKTIVMFCTGGIRCEKAALYMQDSGFANVYQLDGGILGYFNEVGGEHYQGDCFVFDDRVTVSCKSANPC